MWRRKKSTTQQPPLQPSRIVTQINGAKRNLADRLNQRTRHWNKRQQILFLIAVSAILLGLNFLSIYTGGDTTRHLHQEGAVVPLPSHWKLPNISPQFGKQDSITFMAFRERLDSLLSTEEGRAQLDSFNQQRPGFLDSILHVERKIFPTLAPIDVFSNRKHVIP